MFARIRAYLAIEVADARTAVGIALDTRNARHLVYALPTPLFRIVTR